MPATARFGGVAQQDSAEVGIHGFSECLEVSVEERPGAGDKAVRAQLPEEEHTGRSLPHHRVLGLQFLAGNGGLWKTSSDKTAV